MKVHVYETKKQLKERPNNLKARQRKAAPATVSHFPMCKVFLNNSYGSSENKELALTISLLTPQDNNWYTQRPPQARKGNVEWSTKFCARIAKGITSVGRLKEHDNIRGHGFDSRLSLNFFRFLLFNCIS